MIQRVQTIFLILAALSSILMFSIPIGELLTDDQQTKYMVQLGFRGYEIILRNQINQYTTFYSLTTSLLAYLIIPSTLWNIFLFKNRKLQIKLNLFNILLCIVQTIIIITSLTSGELLSEFQSQNKIIYDSNLSAGCLLPLITIAFLLLANKYIKKDEELIRSADRLR